MPHLAKLGFFIEVSLFMRSEIARLSKALIAARIGANIWLLSSVRPQMRS